MIVGTTASNFDPQTLKIWETNAIGPSGIHSGENGKDGMMLLRDIAFGEKTDLLDNVNFYLFQF
jgi:hypothetical protein